MHEFIIRGAIGRRDFREDIGGNASVKAKKDITIEGSNVAVQGDGDIDAGGNLNILDGKDRDYSKTTELHFIYSAERAGDPIIEALLTELDAMWHA